VGALGFVELQGTGDPVEDLLGDAAQVPALEPHVVVGGDAGEHRHLFAAEALDAPVGPVGGQTDLGRREPRTAGRQEVVDLGLAVHGADPAHIPRVFQTPPEVTTDAVAEALRVGYRHVDTAAAYLNEREVGEGIRRASIARDQVFIETKIWISDYGSDATLHAFDKSANKLGVDQLDLLLLHQPLASRFDLTLDAYRALEQLRADGKVRAIGVSNFMPEHLDRLLAETSVVPAVNQLEVHPYFQQTDLQRVHSEHSIVTQAWSPIGGSPPTAASTRPPTTTRRCSRSHASTAGPPRR